MKKIINGRKYDTDTASEVGSWWNEYPVNDFQYETETLYRKRNGEFFVFGEGGAMSKYAEARGGSGWSGGSAIVPLSYDKARQWAEEHLDADDYEAAFGEVSEDGDEDAVISVRVPARTRALLDRLAAQSGRPKGEIVSEALAMVELGMLKAPDARE